MRKRIVAYGLLLILTAGCLWAQNPEAMDKSNWTSYKSIDARMTEQPDNIVKTPEGLLFAGFNMGGNAQYSLASSVANQFKDELITIKMIFEGEFVSPEASFLFLALRGTSPSTIFWSQRCYAFLFKETKMEIQKHGRGSNPNFTYNYSEFADLGFDTFPVGEEVEITYGVINNGRIPDWVLIVNGVEVFRGPDNRYGQRVNYNPNMLLQVGMCATNREILGDDSSRSSLLITSIE